MRIDTTKPDGFYIQWKMVLEQDYSGDRPDERDDGFWPSLDKNAAGWIGSDNREEFERQQAAAQDRMDAWCRGDWSYVGVIAEARCLLVRNGVGTFYTLRSPGLWGVESDAGDYLKEVFEEQKDELRVDIAAMKDPIEEVA